MTRLTRVAQERTYGEVMDFQLPDGRSAHVRPIAAEDKPLLGAAMLRLSAASSYGRFLSPKSRLSAAELRYLTEVDGHDHFALVALATEGPRRLVGVGRYVRQHDDPRTAELAVVVDDQWQGLGLGRRLGLSLAEHAREHGLQRLMGLVLSENVAAHHLLAAISDRRLSRSSHHTGVSEVYAELAA